jgi:hypothetical protein
VVIGDPPFKGFLDVLDWFTKVLFEFARFQSNMFGHGNVSPGFEVVIVIAIVLHMI